MGHRGRARAARRGKRKIIFVIRRGKPWSASGVLLFRDSKGGDGHPEYRPATASGRQTNKKFHTRQSARMAAHSEGEGQGTEHSQRSGWSTSSASLPSTVCDPVQHGLGRRFFIATEEQVCCVRGQRSVIGSRNGHGSGSGATTAWAAGCTRRTRRWCSAARTGRSHLRSTALPRRILSWKLLAEAGLRPTLVLLVTMPYRGRRACAAIRRLWPEAEAGCASEPVAFPTTWPVSATPGWSSTATPAGLPLHRTCPRTSTPPTRRWSTPGPPAADPTLTLFLRCTGPGKTRLSSSDPPRAEPGKYRSHPHPRSQGSHCATDTAKILNRRNSPVSGVSYSAVHHITQRVAWGGGRCVTMVSLVGRAAGVLYRPRQ